MLAHALQKQADQLIDRIDMEMSQTASDTVARFVEVVIKWRTRLAFARRHAVQQRINTRQWQIIAIGDEKALNIWTWVDKGTLPHIIRPKQAGGRLVFQLGYSAFTRPIANANVGNGTYAGPTVIAQVVYHPGTEAREFAAYYALEAEERLVARIKQIVHRMNQRR
jgi:hypothetical protein